MPPVTPVRLGPMPWKGIHTIHARIPEAFPTPSFVLMQALVRDRLTNLCLLSVR